MSTATVAVAVMQVDRMTQGVTSEEEGSHVIAAQVVITTEMTKAKTGTEMTHIIVTTVVMGIAGAEKETVAPAVVTVSIRTITTIFTVAAAEAEAEAIGPELPVSVTTCQQERLISTKDQNWEQNLNLK